MVISTHQNKIITLRTVLLPKRARFGGNAQGTSHAWAPSPASPLSPPPVPAPSERPLEMHLRCRRSTAEGDGALQLLTFQWLLVRVGLCGVLVPVNDHLIPLLDSGRRECVVEVVEGLAMLRVHFNCPVELSKKLDTCIEERRQRR